MRTRRTETVKISTQPQSTNIVILHAVFLIWTRMTEFYVDISTTVSP